MSRFLVIEKVKGSMPFTSNSSDWTDFAGLAQADLAYKLKLEKQGKIVSGGPFLDNLADCYILDVKNSEEMGEIFFNSPLNFWTEREVHPLGTFADSMEGMKEMASSSKKARRR